MPFDLITTVGFLGRGYRLPGDAFARPRAVMTPTERLNNVITNQLSKVTNAERALAGLKPVNTSLAEIASAIREGLAQVRSNCRFLSERRFSHIVANPSISRDMVRQIEKFMSTAEDFSKAMVDAHKDRRPDMTALQSTAEKFHHAIVAFETTIRECAPDQKKKLKDKIAGGIAIPWILAYQIVNAYAMQARDRHAGSKIIYTDDDWIVQLAWFNTVPAFLSIVATLDYLFTPDDCTIYLRNALIGLAKETRYTMSDDMRADEMSEVAERQVV